MTEKTALKKNDKIRLTITDMGINGEGIGKYISSSDRTAVSQETREGEPASGMTFFVKNAVIGDEVLAVVTSVKKGYGYAKVLEILKPSSDRVKPPCPLAERCGGCQIMQLSYEAQLKFKEKKVRNDLERIGGQDCSDFYPILGMEALSDTHTDQETAGKQRKEETAAQPLHFRNKMQFPVGWDREGHVVTGFYAGRTHYIIAAADCPVSPKVNSMILETVRQFLEQRRISAYHEENGQGLMRHILIRNGFYTGQIMVCLVINGDSLEEERSGSRQKTSTEADLVNDLTGIRLPAPWMISSICLNSNKERTNVILGKETKCLYGQPYIEDQITSCEGGRKPLTFRISPLSFFQTNAAQTAKLYDTALAFAQLTGKEKVWDLYCGAGTISLFLAGKAKMVYGVEIIPEAIRDAQENAQRNGISNVRFYCGRSEEIFPKYAKEAVDVVVLDPPRKGCDQALLTAIRKTGPERIVYVSCYPATLARDIKILCAPGVTEKEGDEQTGKRERILEYQYELTKVRPVDMFPHSVHVETVCLLSNTQRKKKESYIKLHHPVFPDRRHEEVF